jgi:hypothetical protein
VLDDLIAASRGAIASRLSRLVPASCVLSCTPGCASNAAAHRWLTQQQNSNDASKTPYFILLLPLILQMAAIAATSLPELC